MGRFRSWQFLASALVGTSVYVALSITVGKEGVWGYRQLAEQRREISAQAARVQKINDELVLERLSLERDKGVIAAYAHRLEYVKDGEKLIKITGLRPYESPLYDTGSTLRRHETKCMSEAVCKATGFLFFALTSLVMILLDVSAKEKRPRSEAKYWQESEPSYTYAI